MASAEIILAVVTAVTAPFSAWLTAVLLRRKYDAEVEQLRAQVEASKAETRGDELDNVKKAMAILMEEVVEPLKKEINAIRQELSRLRKAVEKISGCPYSAHCPVSYELRRTEKGDRIRDST